MGASFGTIAIHRNNIGLYSIRLKISTVQYCCLIAVVPGLKFCDTLEKSATRIDFNLLQIGLSFAGWTARRQFQRPIRSFATRGSSVFTRPIEKDLFCLLFEHNGFDLLQPFRAFLAIQHKLRYFMLCTSTKISRFS